jgi:CCR4-NOT transcriptional complex subunit CAF120
MLLWLLVSQSNTVQIESLPMSEKGSQSLANVLSISTAANNRYLLHFNTLNSLTQWTAGIRLSMFEHATLQEAYTGSLIAGKGKSLNNIRTIMERTRVPYEDWARVRFGAGTPWRKCWFVISPPDEKEYQKMQKAMKKRNPYDKMPTLKGDLKFYESKKITKRTKPIATLTHAYSAYSIYPQSKPLIDQSTLVKIEGRITIHSSPESVNDGFVFVMPETHPAVSGFEMMLRFLFPLWDTFNLYGRPSRLIADVLDQRGLMFAMPKDRRYGYLEILDVAGLIHTDGSTGWAEHQWRKQLKELTSKRMLAIADGDIDTPRTRKSASRSSLPATRREGLRFDESASGRNSPAPAPDYTRRPATALDGANLQHRRSQSEANGFRAPRDTPSRLAQTSNAYRGESPPPRPPQHGQAGYPTDKYDTASVRTGGSSTPDMDPSPERQIPPELQAMATRSPPPGPVGAPPTFHHTPNQKPATRPNQAPDLRRGQAELDAATLTQMQESQRTRSNSSTPPQSELGAGYASHDPYGVPPPNDYQRENDNRYRGTTNPPGFGPSGYQQQQGFANPKTRAPATRLHTIPASPFIDQGSPLSAGPRSTQAEYFPQHAAQNPTGPGLGSTPYTSRSQQDLRTQVQPSAGASGSDPSLGQKFSSGQSADPRPNLERSAGSYGSVTRKPIGQGRELPERRQDYGRVQSPGENAPQWVQGGQQSPYQPQQQSRQQQPNPYYTKGYPPQQGHMYAPHGPAQPQQAQPGWTYEQQQQQAPSMQGQVPTRGPPLSQQRDTQGRRLYDDGQGGLQWI